MMLSDSEEIMAWLGPAIGPECFEVGAEVREAFLAACDDDYTATNQCFHPQANKPGYYLADLYQLARIRLKRLGVTAVYGGDFCTVTDAENFYSYRRESVTGRMASLIYLT